MGKRKNKLEDDIDDVFGGWAIPQEGQREPVNSTSQVRTKTAHQRATKEQNRGVKTDPQKKTLKIRPSETVYSKTNLRETSNGRPPITRSLRLSTTFQRRTSFSISMRSMRSFYHHLSRQIVCPD